MKFEREILARGFVPPYHPRTMRLKLSGLLVLTTVPMEQRLRRFSEAVLMHRTDVQVLLEKKLELRIVHCRKNFQKCTLIPSEYLLYASPQPSHDLQNREDRNTSLLTVCVATESRHYLYS